VRAAPGGGSQSPLRAAVTFVRIAQSKALRFPVAELRSAQSGTGEVSLDKADAVIDALRTHTSGIWP
jgi:hypothetical protein